MEAIGARWDGERAQALIGCRALVGLTFVDDAGRVQRRAQRHGQIIAAHPDLGVTLRLSSPGHDTDGQLYQLPPDLAAFSAAKTGVFVVGDDKLPHDHLVRDPDVVATWVVELDRLRDRLPELLECGFVPQQFEL